MTDLKNNQQDDLAGKLFHRGTMLTENDDK